MKLIKPQQVAYLQRVIERDQRFHLCVGAALYVPMDAPRNLLPEPALWKLAAATLGAETPLDEMVAKSRGEFLVAGSAFAGGGVARKAVAVRVRVGETEKRLTVVGDRQWVGGAMSDPAPFTEMPVAWDRAFGGEGHAHNPVGRGLAPVRGPNGPVHSLPNIEHPDRLVRRPEDRPPPTGLRPIDITWQPRAGKAGTYDDAWLKNDFPGLARDADWTIYNVAPQDQWVPDFFRGASPWLVEGMHPDKPVLEGTLPDALVRCFVNRASRGAFTEVPMRIDTVWLFPNQERLMVIYRGVEEVEDDDAPDVDHMVLACEDPAAPRGVDYYRACLDERLHPERGPAATQRERELMPDWPHLQVRAIPEDMKALDMQNLVFRNLRKRGARKALEARAYVASLGLDPDLHAPPAPSMEQELPPTLEELPMVVEKAEREAAERREKADARMKAREDEMRKRFAALGMDFGLIEKEMSTSPPGPPRKRAPEKLALLQRLAEQGRRLGVVVEEIEQMLADPAFRDRLVMADEGMLKGYIASAQHWTPASRKPPELSAQWREHIQRYLAAGGSLAGADLTGLDLSGMDLRGRDLRGALMEGTLLAETDLREATLTDAVLTRAELTRTLLSGAKLDGANLACAVFAGTQLDGASLRGAQLFRARFEGANLSGADLREATLSEARFDGSVLRGAVCEKLFFYKVDLSGMDLSGAKLAEAIMVECTADGTDFSGADARQLSIVMTRARGARFVGAAMRNARIQVKADLTGCDFRRAVMPESNLRDVPLEGADFSGADLTGCDFSNCNLRGAKFVAADAKGSRWVRADLSDADLRYADLMEAVLQKATLDGTDFREANLYAADMARVLVRRPARMDGAHLQKTRVYPKRKHEPR